MRRQLVVSEHGVGARQHGAVVRVLQVRVHDEVAEALLLLPARLLLLLQIFVSVSDSLIDQWWGSHLLAVERVGRHAVGEVGHTLVTMRVV